MDLESWRSQIPVTLKTVYMNTGWSGPSPSVVLKAINDFLDYQNSEGPTARKVLDREHQIRDDTKAKLASLLNVSPQEILLTQNTTEGLNIVISGLNWHVDDEVIVSNMEHGALLVPCHNLHRRYGVTVRVLDLAPDDSESAILDKLDQIIGSKTRLVALSHITYCNGMNLPIREIQTLVRQRGSLLLIDAAQSVGQIPVDLKELDCDFYSLPGHKWLLGPDGVGALYIREPLISAIEPSYVAGGAVAERSTDRGYTFKVDSIDKFRLSTTSGALIAGFNAAIDFINIVGMNTIQARNTALADRLRSGLASIPQVSILSPKEGPMACSLVCYSVDGIAAQETTAYLANNYNVIARSVASPPATRISLDFFNTEAEVDMVVEAIHSLATLGLPEVSGSTARENAMSRASDN